MKSMRTFFLASTLGVFLCGCSTTATFQLPPNSQVHFDNRQVSFPAGQVESRPFYWNSSKGIAFKLEKNGEVVKEGKLQARFRPASIFWPPPLGTALIYWPMGFAQSCYDLNRAPPYKCAGE